MESELRIGVIGVGGRGALAKEAHRPEEGIRLVAGADIREDCLREFAETYGPNAYVTRDWRALLAEAAVDAVFITTPDNLHEEQAVAAIEAGIAVYLEKPMAISVAGCDRILEVAVRNRSKLYLGHNMRHMAFVEKMKELIDAGAIGEVKAGWCRHFVGYGGDAYFKDWHSERVNTTGLLLQKGAHDIDVLHWLCGGYTVLANGMGGLTLYHQVKNRRAADDRGDPAFRDENWPPLSQQGLSPVIDDEDLSSMQMVLDNGVFATYMQCHYAPDTWRNYTIIGTEGRIENFGDDPADSTVRVFNKRSGYDPWGSAQYEFGLDGGGHGGADPKIVAEFIQYLREGGPVKTSPISARNSVAAGCAATESLRNGGIPVPVPPVSVDALAYFEGAGAATS